MPGDGVPDGVQGVGQGEAALQAVLEQALGTQPQPPHPLRQRDPGEVIIITVVVVVVVAVIKILNALKRIRWIVNVILIYLRA